MEHIQVKTIDQRLLVRIITGIILLTAVTLAWADYPIMSQHYAADPTAVEWEGRLYVYCSNDEENTENSGYIMDSIACFSTDDLKNWTDHGVVFDADDLSSWYSGTAWAPCIVAHDGQLYLYFSDPYWGVGVVTSTSPTGPFTAPKNDLVVKRGVTPGADSDWLFDPGVFVDDDGTAYMYFGGGGANQARYIELDSNLYDSVGSAVTIEFPDFFEASHMHKYNGLYYYSYADNYDSDYTVPEPTAGSQIGYMTGTSPIGPFTYQGVALGPPPNNYGNNNHHTFFTYQGQWYCVYHNRYQAGIDGVSTTEHRNICLDELSYNPDGTIEQVTITQDGLPQLKNLDPFVRVEGETIAHQSGVNTEVCSEGGMNVTSITNGDWIRVRGVDFGAGANSFVASVAAAAAGGRIELRLDGLDGTLIGTCTVPNTGGNQVWTTAVCAVSGASGVHDLYLTFTGPDGGDLFNLDWWQFQIDSITSTTVTVDASTVYQTIEGIGGALCFYNGWVTAHPYKQEIYDHAFSGLNISMLRLANWWRGTDGQDADAYEFVSEANQRLDYSVPILMSSWSPPAYLKSNGEVGNGGTLIQVDGEYDYAGFADYWYDSLQDYSAHGIEPTWIGIQNEPDWTASYDSCRFDPVEDEYASFALAQDAVHERLQSIASPPKLLSPECVGLYGNAGGLQNFMAAMNPDSFYGIAHHLYGGSTDGTPDGYNSVFTTVLNSSNTLFPGKPRFMTEFGDITGLINVANLIHNSLVVEQVSGYNHWCLIWPGEIGLVEIEFPWGYYGDGGEWTNPKGYWLNPSYWSMKHYTYFIEQGFKRIAVVSGDSDVLASAYVSPDYERLVAVFINRSTTNPANVTLNTGSFAYDTSNVYQTAGDAHFVSLGPVAGSQLTLPVSSVTTVVLDHYGPAAPMGLSATSIVDSQVNLSWDAAPGATSYNIKRSITSGGPYTTIAGDITTTSFSDTTVTSGTTYYYVISSNTPGGESSDSGEVVPSEVNTYLKFDETGGTTALDSTGNGWTGALVDGPVWNSGKFSNAVYLDGNDDYVSLASGVVEDLTECTISAWVYLNSVENWSRIFDFGTGTSVNMFLTPKNSATSTVRFAITDGGAGSEQQINGSAALASDTWTHVAVTLNGSAGVLYVNGEPVGHNNSMSLTADSLGTTTQNYIGKSQYSADAYLDGRVDDFRIYSTALSAVDIASLYEEDVVAAAPSSPTNIEAASVSGSQIDVTWSASDNTTNYNVKRSTASGGSYSMVASVSGTTYCDTGLPELTPYYYVVSAVNGAGESADSTEVEAVTQSAPPSAPSGLEVTAVDGAVTLSWNENTEVDLAGYNIYRSTTPAGGYILQNTSLLNSPEFTDTDIDPYTPCYYVVTAVDLYDYESAYSDETEALPVAAGAVQVNAVDFESGLEDWINNTDDDSHDWIHDSGGTMTPNTGPDSGADDSTWYVYLETSPTGAGGVGDTAILESPVVGGLDRVLMFYYHLYGAEIGTLYVDVYDGSWHDAVWSISGQQQSSGDDEYARAVVDLSGYTGAIKIRYRAESAGGPRGDMAIDDIVVFGRLLYGDMNGDHHVDAEDFVEFIGYWLQGDCDLDLDGDCVITLYEFSEFAENWLDHSL